MTTETMDLDVRKRKQAETAGTACLRNRQVAPWHVTGARAEEPQTPGFEPEEAAYQLKALKRGAGSLD